MAQANNITTTINKLTNLELSIQISLSGLSFCILQRDTQTITDLKVIPFKKKLNPIALLDKLKEAFETETALQNKFYAVNVIHDNELSTLVPQSIFNENNLADYLKFNSKILKSDFITFDTIDLNQSVNVYIPYVNVNNYIYDHFGDFTFKHASTVLIETILATEKTSETTQFYAHVGQNQFQIIVLKNGKLQFYNSFVFHTKEDFIYYILFTAEQLKASPESLNLLLLGDVKQDDELYNIAYKYIRNVSFGQAQKQYKFTETPETNHSNFTLINGF
ncbi:DUF3822 family protein [Algibacter miyuki]|uniref:DUF3822 family protein n=1 Tax=Algibacter miyuki TaxID=1306933 RepID=A0ABV5GXT9_9FLAO|nr:DUF3822 family protein [Algibacter miyuki]MDN3667467.1 DUF3822 family protein [Algibacter miyuki]